MQTGESPIHKYTEVQCHPILSFVPTSFTALIHSFVKAYIISQPYFSLIFLGGSHSHLARQNIFDLSTRERFMLQQCLGKFLQVSPVGLEAVPRALVGLVQQVLHLFLNPNGMETTRAGSTEKQGNPGLEHDQAVVCALTWTERGGAKPILLRCHHAPVQQLLTTTLVKYVCMLFCSANEPYCPIISSFFSRPFPFS